MEISKGRVSEICTETSEICRLDRLPSRSLERWEIQRVSDGKIQITILKLRRGPCLYQISVRFIAASTYIIIGGHNLLLLLLPSCSILIPAQHLQLASQQNSHNGYFSLQENLYDTPDSSLYITFFYSVPLLLSLNATCSVPDDFWCLEELVSYLP